MSDVYRNANSVAAHSKDCQDGLRAQTLLAAAKSRAILAAHVDENHSQILVERDAEYPDTDWNIVLDDTRGLLGAMTIEYGRKGGRIDSAGRKTTPMAPVAPLRIGVGIPVDE